MPTVSHPAIAVPAHKASLDEVIDHYAGRYPSHPRLADSLRVMRATGVGTRSLAMPLDELTSPGLSMDERLARHFDASCDLAEQAVVQALRGAAVDAAQLTGLVCVSATGYDIPGLDVAVANRLGLPSDLTRIPATQMGCNGGAWAVARAAEMCAATPAQAVLVIAADVFLPFIHPADAAMDSMIYRALIGDAAGACVVRSDGDASGPALRVHASWDHMVAGTGDIVGFRVRQDGLHVFNSPRLFDALREAVRELTGWLDKTGGPPVEFLVAHSGGPRILQILAETLNCDPGLLHHSEQSLRQLGNAGSVSFLDVLARTYAEPPAPGSHGLAIAVGPGVAVTASQVTWQ